MNLVDNCQTSGGILSSFLSAPEMLNFQPNEENNWQLLETNYQPQDQIIWHLESPKAERAFPGSENLIQHIPVTYLATENPNLTFTNGGTVVEPVTYILSRNVIPEPITEYCTVEETDSQIIENEPQNFFFIQETKDATNKVFSTAPNMQYMTDNGISISYNESVVVEESYEADELKSSKCNEINIISSNSLHEAEIESKNVCNEEEINSAKIKLKKKISRKKKPIRKRKKTTLYAKQEMGKKGVKKKHSNLNSDVDKSDEEGEKLKRNLFELTKLEDDVSQVAERLKFGCECSDSNCFDGLNPDNVFKHRLNIADLTKAEHDMYLMGVIMASFQNLEETSRHTERIRIRSCYAYQGKKVCLTAFLYLQHVTLYQMKRLRSHLKNHGVSPRTHGNCGRKPANTFSLDIYRRATNFIHHFIEKHCLKSNKVGNKSNSAVTGSMKKQKVKINKMTSYHLPSEWTKKTVHKEYKSYCENLKPNQKVMKYSTFTSFVKKQFPYVKFPKLDKKLEERSESKSLRSKQIGEHPEGELWAEKGVQTMYLPAEPENVQMAQCPAFVVASQSLGRGPEEPQYLASSVVDNSQIVLGGQHLQYCTSGNEMQAPGQVLLGNPIYNPQCVPQAPAHSQIYTVDKIV